MRARLRAARLLLRNSPVSICLLAADLALCRIVIAQILYFSQTRSAWICKHSVVGGKEVRHPRQHNSSHCMDENDKVFVSSKYAFNSCLATIGRLLPPFPAEN